MGTKKRGPSKLAAAVLAAVLALPLPYAFAEDMGGASIAQKNFGWQPYPMGDSGVIQQIGDTCRDPGDSDGDYRCIKTFSNGVRVVVMNDQEHHGDNFKRQTQIAEFSANGGVMNSRTVRQKTAYTYIHDQKKVRAEFFDIVNRPRGRKVTREIIIYEYNAATEKLKTLTWTSYEQIGESSFAMITRNIMLNYDDNGDPLKGRVERWENQVPVERLFYWDRISDGMKNLNAGAWQLWQDQVIKASPRRIF